MIVLTLTLATIDGANRRYGPVLVPALLVILGLLWLANRPVRQWQPRIRPARQGPGLLAGLGSLILQVVVSGLLDRLQARRAGVLPDAMVLRPPPAWRQAELDAGRGLRGAGMVTGTSRPAMPAPSRPHSEFYDDYLAGRTPSPYYPWAGCYWPTEVRPALLAEHRRSFGPTCQGGWVCQGMAMAVELDHCAKVAGYPHDYAMLGRETTRDTAAVCRDCHVYREQLKRQHVNAWLLPQTIRKWRRP